MFPGIWQAALGLFLFVFCLFPVVSPAGDREYLNPREYPWSAVGKVNIGGKAQCSGVLIAEDLVLTAAHCLFNARTGRWWRAESVHFLAAYEREKYDYHSKARAYLRDDFVLRRQPDVLDAENDWAILELEKPLGRQTGYIPFRPLSREDWKNYAGGKGLFVQLGYHRARKHRLSAKYDCKVLGFLKKTRQSPDSNILVHDCSTLSGDSGGPLLMFNERGVQVVAVNSMVADLKGAPHALATVGMREAPFHPLADRPPAVWRYVTERRLPELRATAPLDNGKIRDVPLDTALSLMRDLGLLAPADAGAREVSAAEIAAVQGRLGLTPDGRISLPLLAALIRRRAGEGQK